jgi:integrase
VRRESLPIAAPRALSRDEQRVLLLRAAERAGARDRALVVLMLFAGLRIGETVAWTSTT